MGLAEDLQGEQKPQGDLCTVQKVMEAYPQEADGIWEAVCNPDIRGAHIARVFGDYGFRTGSDTVNRHRRGECLCELRMPERYVSD